MRKARLEEVGYIKKINFHKEAPKEKAKKAGAKVISVRWIVINKGDPINENYRSRLVARQIKTSVRPDHFAVTPPLEAMKLGLSMLASSNQGEKLMVNDVSRTFFCACAKRQVFVELPEEDREGTDMVGELLSVNGSVTHFDFTFVHPRDGSHVLGDSSTTFRHRVAKGKIRVVRKVF